MTSLTYWFIWPWSHLSGRRGSNSPPIAWKAIALPNELLPHILKSWISKMWCERTCGQGWIRTTELRRGQIYSLLPLATWLLARPEPLVGIEPTAYWLQISCSTGWAKVALCCFNYQGINATKNYTIKSYPKISLPKIREAKVREFDNCKNFERGIFYLYSASCEYL